MILSNGKAVKSHTVDFQLRYHIYNYFTYNGGFLKLCNLIS